MPAIDRDFWLEFARDGISKSIEKREKAADKLDTFLLWIWGIYTTLFALGSIFDYVSSNLDQLIWVAQPIFVIMLSRYACVMVSMPTTGKGKSRNMRSDPNDVASIISSFVLIVDNKRKKLLTAQVLTLVSIVSISAALVGYNVFDPNKRIKQEIQKAELQKGLYETRQSYFVSPQNLVNDSIQSLNEYYKTRIELKIKQLKHECLEQRDLKCYDSIRKIAK